MGADDFAVVGGGGTAALGFVLGVVQRYVAPRFEALRERVAKLEAENAALQTRCDTIAAESANERAKVRESAGVMVTKAHDRINALEAATARIDGKMTMFRRDRDDK